MVRNFQWYSYNERDNAKVINFPECKLLQFETEMLLTTLEKAFEKLKVEDGVSAIALEPKDTSCDAVDMFALVKKGQTGTTKDWCFYLLQDTISRDHSLHPVKVLWYCALLCDAYKKVFLSSSEEENDGGEEDESPLESVAKSLLKCCKYVPVVPQQERKFAFKKPVANSNWNEVERVATLLGYEFPKDFSGNKRHLKKLKMIAS